MRANFREFILGERVYSIECQLVKLYMRSMERKRENIMVDTGGIYREYSTP